jgi:hypothetical protein
MHFLLGKKDKSGIMSMKKKKTAQKKTADIPVVRPKGHNTAKRSESVPKNPPRPAFGSIGRSFSVLLDRTKDFLRPAEKADA